MSKEFEIKGGVCPVALEERVLAPGYDSDVYLFGRRILKVYNKTADNPKVPNDPETLLLYWLVTNKIANAAEKENFTFQIPYTEKKYPVRLNPIRDMWKCKHCGFVTSESLYIPGNNLKYFPEEFDPEELHIGLRNLGLSWERRFNVSGISLIPLNIKKRVEPLIVTDLCSDISKLRQRIF